jgi:hypothetical protein
VGSTASPHAIVATEHIKADSKVSVPGFASYPLSILIGVHQVIR